MNRLDASLISIFQKADKSFRVRRGQLQTAVNDDGFEIDVIRRIAMDNDPHPLPMSSAEEDLWAVQVGSGNQLVSGRRHEQMVVSARGDMALMRTVHPLDFIRVKTALAASVDRDPLKRPSLRRTTAERTGQTGVEMEALTATSAALLTIYDMCKAVVDRSMTISGVRLIEKHGGKSGSFVAP